MTTRLGLYELLAPQFLAGFTFPAHIDRYLSVLGVDELRTTYDDTGVVYAGRCSFVGGAGAEPVREHHDPSGAVLKWEDVTLDFRLTLPRDGAAFIGTAIGTVAGSSVVPADVKTAVASLGTLFDSFGAVEETATTVTDYPGVRMRLELMLNTLTFHLPRDSWVPGIIGPDFRPIPKPPATPSAGPEDVKFLLPKIVFVYEQGDDLSVPPSFRIDSWGSSGFDAPADLLEGEVVRMDPPIALHTSGQWAFGVDELFVDLSPDHTPPEILQFFGIDESFEGIYVKSARIYYEDDDKDLAINVSVNDLLISFTGEVSLEARVDFLGPETTLRGAIHMYENGAEVQYTKGRPHSGNPTLIEGGKGSLLNTGVILVDISGGVPPLTASVTLAGTEIWSSTSRSAPISPGAPGTLKAPGEYLLRVSLADAGTAQQTYVEEVVLTVRSATTITPGATNGAPADAARTSAASVSAAHVDPPTTAPPTAPPSYALLHVPSTSGTLEEISVQGPGSATALVGGVAYPISDGKLRIDVRPSQDVTIQVTYPAVGTDRYEEFNLYFDLGRPDRLGNQIATEDVFNAQIRPQYVSGSENDARFDTSTAPGGGSGLMGPAALTDWIQNRALSGPDQDITIDGYASFERDENLSSDQRLSDHRVDIARDIITAARTGVVFGHADGHGHGLAISSNNRDDRVAKVRARVALATPAVVLNTTIHRGPSAVAPPPPHQSSRTATPQPAANQPPGIFRRISFRIRIERNALVLGEISGELDFETDMEATLRATPALSPTANLGLTNSPANTNPKDGVCDFLLGFAYDTATHALTETIAFGASPDDKNGLFQMQNRHVGSTLDAENHFKDAFGALLILAPVINSAAGALDPKSAGDWAKLVVSIALPATIGGLGLLQTETVTFYGGELRFRQYIPPGEGLTFTNAAVLFDYSVDFGLAIPELGVQWKKLSRVRYKAVGFSLNFAGTPVYQPVFDTSKGYELNLEDTGLLKLPSPLDEILKILAVRVSRFNPLTLEVDLGMKVDLGVVKVDKFKVKWPLDPLGVPMILPTSARIEIAGTLIGSGSVNIVEPPHDPPPDAVTGGGFDGTLDVSLVAFKLRIAASLGVRDLKDPAHNRRAIAVFAGLIVDFMAPILFGQSGLGLFGLSGLFAMHYKRIEAAPVPGDSIGPALHWLVNPAEGEPAKLINSSGVDAWGPELDKWSFGVGAVIGTTDSFLVQLRGMFVLELPGPRILIFVKIQIVSKLEGLKPAAKLIIGILGVIDFDLNLGHITLGVLVDFEIKEILTVQIPIELFFNLHDASDWHFYIGTFSAKVTARILNLVNAYGYFMVSGKTIVGWPGRAPTRDLPGLAVATGLAASITIGNTSIGLYLRVAAGLDMAVAFSPYFMVGEMYIDGELRLFIISVEAHGTVHVEAPDPTYAHGQICGKIDFFFFSVSGCVDLTIGSNVRTLPAPALVQNVFLQSHAPVITAGQGGDRPIDASLGDASASASPGPSDVQIPVVPIDSVPVVQMHASPNVAGATCFAGPLVTPPFPTPDYFIDVGGGRKVKYVLKEISLTPPLPAAAGTPPATWRPDASGAPGGVKTDVDLALMSRVPITGERAIERSSELDELVTVRWENLCTPVAPAVCILWTFCGQPLGPSGHGWTLAGIAQPDPPGTTRTAPPPTTLVVEEPAASGPDALLGIALGASGSGRALRAKVIGPGGSTTTGGGEGPGSPLTCLGLSLLHVGSAANPRHVGGVTLEVRGPGGAPLNASTVKRMASFTGLDAGFRTIVTLSAPSHTVEVRLVSFALQARVTAFNSNGSTSTAAMTAPPMTPDLVRLTGPGIVRLVIDAPSDETLILDVCTEEQQKVVAPPVPRVVAKTGDARRDRLALAFNARRYRRALKAYQAALRVPAIASSARDPIPLGRVGNGPLAAPGRFGVSVNARPGGSQTCYRALQLPERLLQQHGGDIKPTKRGLAVDAKRPSLEWITLDTGEAKRVRLYLALAEVLFAKGGLRMRQLGAANAVLREDDIASLPTTFVTGVATGLPAAWTDPGGPWAVEVTPVAVFIADAQFSSLVRGVVDVKPESGCLKIQLVVPKSAPTHEVPAALLSVVEVCPKSETDRVATATSAQSGDRDTLISYLSGSASVPLLQPATPYQLQVRYDAISRAADGTESTEANQTQNYYFRTDDQAPKRIDPWVLATTPNDEERFVFYQDPLKIVFNDTAIVQLYAAYGKSLRATLRAADGVVIPAHEVTSLDATPADLDAPYREYLEGMVASGALPCTGSITSPSHGTAVLPMPLRPLMAYTLDLEVVPPDATPAPGKPTTPLFRRSFTTGRYASVQALVDDFRGRSVRHRVLSSQLSGLPTTGSVVIATDQDIQSALLAAGEQPLSAPEIGGVTVYWAKRTGASTFSPHAILIDAAEAVWRLRSAPTLEVVPGQVLGQNDPSYERVVPGEETSMEIIESGSAPSSAIARFAHSPSGTRTLAIISDTFTPGAGSKIELHLHRPSSTLYGLADENTTFLTIPLGASAPWEEDA